jgi:Flp pilus assembly protein TadG
MKVSRSAAARSGAARRHFGREAGTTSLEFALVCSTLIVVILGILGLGLMVWTQQALQASAELTARCVTLGATTCANAQQFAVNTVSTWSFSGVVTTGNVWVQSGATCTSTNGHVAAGKFTVVTISSNYWTGGLLPAPFSAVTLTATACYPSAA